MSTNTDFDADISSDPALAALDFDDIVIPQADEPETVPAVVEVKDPEVEAIKAQQKAEKPQPVVGSLNPEGANSSSSRQLPRLPTHGPAAEDQGKSPQHHRHDDQ